MSDIFERINRHHTGLLSSKVARKYKLLTEDPFRFFRGTNHLFYEDLSQASLPNSPVCWICGDLHVENFGSYKGDNRLVYFDLNDFDESILAPVAWELARLMTSILVAFDALKFTDEEALRACEIFLKKYESVLADGCPRYIERRTTKGIVKRFLTNVEQRSDKDLLAKRTLKKNGVLKLSSGKNKQLMIDADLKEKLISEFTNWMTSTNQLPNSYRVLDVRFRVAGTGSLGICRYVFLLQKIDSLRKHMLIDMKQATPSSLQSFVKIIQPPWESEAHRMVVSQRMMQNIPPAQLSTINFQGESYLIQEMQPTKDRINFRMIQDDLKLVYSVLEDMATITASAHLRSASRKGACSADELMAFGKDVGGHAELLNYALGYKNKVIDYWHEFKRELKIKRLRKAV